MTWLKRNLTRANCDAPQRLERFEAVFVNQRPILKWIALAIVGNEFVAERCVQGAKRTAIHASVYVEWMGRWLRSVTARTAVEAVHEDLKESEGWYKDRDCAHGEHSGMSDDYMATVLACDIDEFTSCLDVLARSVLVLRGVLGFTTDECALHMQVDRRAVSAAYCRAMSWIEQRAAIEQGPQWPIGSRGR